MTGPLIYPPADHTTQWVGKGSVTMPMDHVKWLQHTTETAGGWPSYDYGGVHMGSAPTLTYEPWQHKWRQHFEINQSARALQNDGSFYTNRVDVVQTEISCYCDHSLSQKYGHSVTALDDQAINDLGDFGAWLVKEWGMKADSFYPSAIPWPAYPKGCQRMADSEFAAFSGIVGHMAAPGNSHLDPGDLDNVAVKARIDATLGGSQGGGGGQGQGGGSNWPNIRELEALIGGAHESLWSRFESLGEVSKNHPNLALVKSAAAHLQKAMPEVKAARLDLDKFTQQKG